MLRMRDAALLLSFPTSAMVTYFIHGLGRQTQSRHGFAQSDVLLRKAVWLHVLCWAPHELAREAFDHQLVAQEEADAHGGLRPPLCRW
jgi:hypothetical protein